MRYFGYAVIAAALTFFITLPILGVHLNQSAQGLSLTGDIDLNKISVLTKNMNLPQEVKDLK